MEPDFESEGLYGLGLTRTYRSMNNSGTLFGPNWLSNLDFPKLARTGLMYTPSGKLYSSVTITLPGGVKYRYAMDNYDEIDGYWATYTVAGATATGTLSYDRSNGWALYVDKKVYNYNELLSLTTIVDNLSGDTLNFQQMSPTVTKVTNVAGKSIQFFKDSNNRVTQVIDPAGNTWSYAYNAAGMLTLVTSPGPLPDIRQYHYEDGVSPTRLTGISINGLRYSRYTYYADGKVKQSALEGGAEEDNFTYDVEKTTVTDFKGQTSTYGYTTTCFSICVGGATPGPGVTVTAGKESGHSKGSAHEIGEACDVGKNSNPTLTRAKTEECYNQCFPAGSSWGQEEGNHYHMQTRPGRNGGTGFIPGVH